MSKTSENFVASVLRTDPVKSCCLLHQMFEEAGRKIFCHKTKQFTILLQKNYMGWVGDFGRLLHNSEYPIKSEQNQSILYIYYLWLQLSYKDNFQKKVLLFFIHFISTGQKYVRLENNIKI